jgi:AraC-like DNA-binding protein
MFQMLDDQEQTKKRFQNPEIINLRAPHRYLAARHLQGIFEQQFGDKVKLTGQPAPVAEAPQLVPVNELPESTKIVGDIAAHAGLNDLTHPQQLIDEAFAEQANPVDLNRILDVSQNS